MNPKIERINTEIEKMKGKISDFQSRVKDLERQKNELENTEIVAAIRSADINHQELLAFIHAYRTRGAAAETMLESHYEQEQEDYEDDEA